MNIQKIMEEIDVLYSQQKVEEVEALLLEKIGELKENKEVYPALSLTNELLGIYREKGDRKKGMATCEDLLAIFHENNLKKDENYGTTLLNVATAQRSFGYYEEARAYYDECMEIYRDKIPPNDYRYASLYNNLNLLCCELGELPQAIDHLEKSLAILSHHLHVEVQVATANTSLAQIYSSLGQLDLAQKHSKIALELFQDYPDYHYSGALATAANIAFLLEKYQEAADFYQKAMDEIEQYLGRTENYKVLEENLQYVLSFLSPPKEDSQTQENKTTEVPEKTTKPEEAKPEEITAPEKTLPSSQQEKDEGPFTGLELSRRFYEEYGAKMLATHFPQYLDKIAVGLVGEGSECFGFDDKISQDHDFGPGFCLWISDELEQIIGHNLAYHYGNLPKTYKGITRTSTETAGKRVGVFSISDFYGQLLDGSIPTKDMDWLLLEDNQLAQASNGAVFRDDLGEFSKIRAKLLNHYPQGVLRQKMGQKAHEISQKGQYNYARMLNRGDFVTARLILCEFLTNVMEMVFYLNKMYAPFYKWTYKKMKQLPVLSHLSRPIHEINGLAIDDPKILGIIEGIVAELLGELHKQNYISAVDKGNFLDNYVEELCTVDTKVENQEKKTLVDQLVSYEWKAFDQVQGMDGRASCQDDYETFEIMRSSQFYVWSTALLESYALDFETALQQGRNLVTEKYAFMMRSTDPDNFQKMESRLPAISPEKRSLIEEIVAKQMKLVLELQPNYPKFVNQGRSLHTKEDNLYNTSYETYLRGELSSYSMKTVELYGEMLDKHKEENRNTARCYMENVASQYGYEDLDAAEASLTEGV